MNEILIDQIKHQYGEVYDVKIDKLDVMFRPLTLGEYTNFASMDVSSVDLEELVIYTAVFWPQPFDLDKIKPGAVTALSDNIIEKSGFLNMESIVGNLDHSRQKMGAAIELMKTFVLATMPTYRLEELDELTLSSLTDLVARAESIIEIQASVARGSEVTLQLTPVEEEEKKQQPVGRKTHSFTIEDIEKDNRLVERSDIAPPTEGMWDKGPKVVKERGSMVGVATADDPIAQKLQRALQNTPHL